MTLTVEQINACCATAKLLLAAGKNLADPSLKPAFQELDELARYARIGAAAQPKRKSLPPFEDAEFLGPKLAMACRHIEWLVTRGMGPSTDSWGIRENAKQFIEGAFFGQVLTRWPTSHKMPALPKPQAKS